MTEVKRIYFVGSESTQQVHTDSSSQPSDKHWDSQQQQTPRCVSRQETFYYCTKPYQRPAWYFPLVLSVMRGENYYWIIVETFAQCVVMKGWGNVRSILCRLVIICLFAQSSPPQAFLVALPNYCRHPASRKIIFQLFSKVTMTSWRVINNSP